MELHNTRFGRGQGHWRTYDGADGLASGGVYSILQDQKETLWFCTENGVSRYDGRTWKTFTTKEGLASNGVASILQDLEGHFWFGTWKNGVSRYDGQIWKTFTAKEGLAGNSVNTILQDREGVLWFGTGSHLSDDGGVSRYDGRTWKTFTAEDGLMGSRVYAILQDRDGCFWFGTNAGVSRYDGQTWTTFTTEDGLTQNVVISIARDRDGVLWFGTGALGIALMGEGRGVCRYDGQTFTAFTKEDGLAGNLVYTILEDREGDLWFGTDGGVSRYDGQAWMTFTTADGLARNEVYAILQDREGHFWFGTWGGGVSRYSSQTFTTFTAADGLPSNWVRSVFRDPEGCLWFGTRGGGVSRYDGQTLTTYTVDDGLANNWVESIYRDREGNLWFGTVSGGVSRYDGRRFSTLTANDGLAGDRVYAVLQDREGCYWFVTHLGVSRYDGRRWTTFTTEDGLADNDVQAILQDREGNLWFGSSENGASQFDGRTWRVFTAEDGLAGNSVNTILQDREGNLWFGTESGVSRYDGKTWTSLTESGLAHNSVLSILEDSEGRLWFTTYGGGVVVYDGQVCQLLTDLDGLAGNSVWSAEEDRKGHIWFGTTKGLTCYRRPLAGPPKVSIDAVVADRRHEGASDLSIASSPWLTSFEFHGRSFKTRPEAMVYRYRLKGYDDDWQNTHACRAEYKELPVGKYTFEVVAVDRDLHPSDPASLCLTVVPDPRIKALTEALNGGETTAEFVGESEALVRVQLQLAEVAQTDVTVLILGETGAGKGLAAQAVHALSERHSGPFIQVNCGAIPEGLVESELFGHERGAFTGAVSRKPGKVELAEGGTLFLDEIGDLAPEAQAKLLRVLEERTFERVGGSRTMAADVRVIAVTNRDLTDMVSRGLFREDLYFRLQTFPVRMPPLRERRDDIPLLADYFMTRMAAHLHKEVTHLGPGVLEILEAYEWPGNVRELEHAIQHAVIVCRGLEIRPEDIVREVERDGKGSPEEIVTLEEHERRYIRQVLQQCGWIIKGSKGAAARLGMHHSTLRSRMKKLGIVRLKG